MSHGDIVQLAENRVPLALVEGPRLEAHRIQVRVVTSLAQGFAFGHG